MTGHIDRQTDRWGQSHEGREDRRRKGIDRENVGTRRGWIREKE